MSDPVLSVAGGTITETAPNTYKVDWTTGEEMTVTVGGGILNADFALPNTEQGQVQGLLGTGEGAGVDFQTPDGTVLPTPTTNAQLYTTFGDSWRITDATSLFDYTAGQDTETFTNEAFPAASVSLASLPTAVVQQAAALVAAAGITDPTVAAAAELDYIATGDTAFITAAANQNVASVIDETLPASAPPTPAVGVTADKPALVESATGTTSITFDLYQTATSTTDTQVNWTVISTDPTDIAVSAFTGGVAPSGTATIAAGATSGQFTVTLPQSVLGALPEGTLKIELSDPTGPAGVFLFGADAQTLVVNSQAQAGTAPQPTVSLLNGPGTITQTGTAYTVDLGQVLQGQTIPSLQFAIGNAASAPADDVGGVITDPANASFTVAGDGQIAPVIAGASDQTLIVTPNTSASGVQSEVLTFAPTDENDSGYTAALPTETITVTETVIASAVAQLNTPTDQIFGDARVGSVDSLPLNITNGAATGAASLGAAVTTEGNATVTGSLTQIAPGAVSSSDIVAGLYTSTAGTITGTVDLAYSSDAVGQTAAIGSGYVDLYGRVFRDAAPALSLPVGQTVVHVGDAGTGVLTLTNSAAADGYSEGLTASVTGATGGFTASGATGLIAAGASDTSSLTYGFSTATSGVVTGAVDLDTVSDGTGLDSLAPLDLGTAAAPLSVTVDNYAAAGVSLSSGVGTLTQTGDDAYTLDLGSVAQDGYALTAGLSLTNAATGLADLLGASFSTSGDAEFTNTGTADASGLAAGQSDAAPTVSLSTATAGQFSETLTIDPTGSNASGYSGALAPITVTIDGTVVLDTKTFTLTSGSDTIAGGPTVNTIDAPAQTLTSGDSIDGGTSGKNTLVLQGAGIFDLRAPSLLTDIQTVDATEGQAAYSSGGTAIPSAAQNVYLRSGLNLTVDVASDSSLDTANPNAPGITIHGADDSDTINLGSGNDAVYLGSANETVNGGGGNNRFYATAATLGATIDGGSGSNTLYLSGGGAATMGANVTGISKVYLLPPAVGQTQPAWDFTANATAGLSIYDDGASGDTVTVGDASQSVTFGAGDHTVLANAATSAVALFSHGTGHNVLELTGGGTFSLNPVDSDLTVQLDQASTLDLNQNGVGVQGSAGDDTIVAAYGDLTGASAIDGGAGSNTLALSGGGIFDLRAPASLTNIGTITATEGQGEYRSADGTVNVANQEPIIYLRDGLDATVDVASGAALDSANPHPSGVMIYGADNADVINLGSGTDVVHLGSAAETVNGGSGEDLIYADAATLGATIKGGGGTTLVYVTGGGTTAMAANATGVSEVLLLGPDSGQTQAAYDFSAGDQAGLVIEDGTTGGDTIRIGAASQTVLLSGGDHTVVTDTADSTAAMLANGPGDVLEVTDGGAVSLNAADANLTVQLDKASTLTLNTNGVGVQGSSGDDTIVAGYGALTATSAIDGGAGANTLALSGGGIFDLRAPASLSDIATITATEGQGEYLSADGTVSVVGEEPIIYLRDGLDATVDLTPAAAINAANPHPTGAIIYGADNADVINLGSGTNTVYLGSAAETVNGGAGSDLIYATGSTLGATITGGTGTTTLDLTGGGVASMGSNITGVSRVSLLGSTAFAFTANTTAKLEIVDTGGLDGDSITVGAASQTVLLGAGGHHIYATSANAGAAVLSSGTGPNVLEITTGGTSILSGSDANMTVMLDAAGNLTLSTNTGMIAIGSTGADTITAHASGQTLTGNGGGDTLVGWIGGADSFSDTLANLNGTSIKGFAAKGDVIDVTDSAVTTSFTEDASNTFGTLTLTSGAATSKITLFGQFMASGFSTAAEGTSGTAVSYTPPTVQPQAIAAPGH